MPQAGYNETARNVFAVVFRCAAMIACLGGGTPSAHAQQCVLGEPPSDFCAVPRVISGDVGQHVVLMDASAATGVTAYCGMIVGHTVWFQVTPTVTGPVTISTCHPATTYDTVLEVWSGGDAECNLMADVDCNDDTSAPECANGCSGTGSRVTFNATAETRYRFAIGSWNQNSAGCTLCLGVIVTIGQPCGDPPTNIGCLLARELPGTPGTHEANVDVTDAVVLPSEMRPTCGGMNVGHTVWFKTTPTVSGPLTFSTCDPDITTYDTVLQAWEGDCGGLMVSAGCNDDTVHPACTNACPSSTNGGSTVSFRAEAGQEYFFQVGSYNDNPFNCDLCLGATLTLVDQCDVDTTPPIAILSTPLSWPAPSGVTCDSTMIYGSAHDPDGTFAGYVVEYLPVNGSTWIPIYSSPNPVVNGNLLGGGTWNTGALSQGWYFLRLSASNVCGRSSSVVAWLFVDKQYDNASIRSPANGAVLGGSVCVDGTVWDENARGADSYTVRYAPLPAGTPFNPVDPAHLTYAGTVLNDPLASWNTRAGIADGNYRLRLDATDQCGRAATPQARDVVIDNTAPIAVITAPTSCSYVQGQVDILGTASDAHLDGWALYYTGGDAHSWVTIASGTTQVINGLLGRWNTAGLRPCAYTLRLVVTDKSVLDCNGALRNQAEYLVSVNVGAHGDFDADNDGDVDLRDYSLFEDAFTGPR